jgi:hypothetical protein
MSNAVQEIFDRAPAVDMHTHLFPPNFGDLALSGVDELLTYHYLEAEYFRLRELSPGQYFSLAKPARAGVIWDALFVRNAPISEATRGVVAALTAFGLEVNRQDLNQAREFFRSREPETHVDSVMKLANLDWLVMTNDPLDAKESNVWRQRIQVDPRFKAALRLDSIVNHRWSNLNELRSFLEEWTTRMKPIYMAISFSDLSPFLEDSPRGKILREVVVPVCREMQMPLALMIGVKRNVNPEIGLAADGIGHANLELLADLCKTFYSNRLLVTCLQLENQHELCVLARKFSNLMPFGCWWFVNTSSMVSSITQQRIELLGTTFVAQHSDARVLEQLIYKWKDARRSVGEAYSRSCVRLRNEAYLMGEATVAHDANKLLRANFESFCSAAPSEPYSADMIQSIG